MANKSAINPGKFHLGYAFDFPPYQNEEYRDENEIKQLRWKTSVVMNRRAYVGNVRMTEYDGTTKNLSDSIFKSRTNKFDSFTKDRRIDVAVGDGEDIIALAGFADMLLQFKQSTLHIINCSGASEFLEGTYKFKGVDNQASVCSTSFGIAWANKHGVYFFDGRTVQDIFARRGVKRISPETWSAFAGSDVLRVGFLANDNAVTICNDDGDMFLYDMVTQSFTEGKERFSSDLKANFVSAWDGKLFIAYHAGSDKLNINEVSSNASINSHGSSNFKYVSREIDAGNPTQEKKWKSAYVTFRNAGSNKVALKFNGVNKSRDTSLTNLHLDANNKNLFGHTGTYDYTDADWKTVRFPIGSNQYVIQLTIEPVSGQTIPHDFEVNDITLVYRDKSIK